MLLQTFVQEYGLEVDEQHKSDLEDIMSDASAATEKKSVLDSIESMCDGFKVNCSKDKWGNTSYKIVMNNITELKGISTQLIIFYFFTNKGFTNTESLCYNLIVMVP